MKKVYDFLGLLIGVCIGVFLGHVIYTIWDYITFPGLYAMQSAPWYTSILVRGLFTVITVTALLLIRLALRKKIGGRAADE